MLVDIRPAGEVVPGLVDRMVLHSGPPVDWPNMSGAQKGAVIAMVIFEGWADDIASAEALDADSTLADFVELTICLAEDRHGRADTSYR